MAGVDIGDGASCKFVAEISNNHNGDFDRAIRLIDAAKASGADFVKFQCYTADEIVSLRGDGPAPEPWHGKTMHDLYTEAATPMDWFPGLFQHARDIGIVPFSSVFGLESLIALEKCACPAFKIARLDNGDANLGRTVVSRGKPVLVSSSGSDNFVWPIGAQPRQMVRLYCPPGYPVAAADFHLPHMWTNERSEGFIGISSHCLDPMLPLAAAARGCALIEMHMMLEAEPSKLESNVSLTEVQFAQMIADVRRVEAMLA